MKKMLLGVLLAISVAYVFCPVYAENSTRYIIRDSDALDGDKYRRFMWASVDGFDETDNVSLRIGTLRDPEQELTESISKYVTQNNKIIFVEISAYDTIDSKIISLPPKKDMKISMMKPMASGLLSDMGKDYRVIRIDADSCTELSITDFSLQYVTFETDELGIFAIVYDPYAYSLSFIDGEQNEYYRIDNLSVSSIITLPLPPQKEGFRFGGWYAEENGERQQLCEGQTLLEYGSTEAYAHWVSDSYPYFIEDIILRDITGEELSAIPENTSFIAEVVLDKSEAREDSDYVFVAVYDTSGALISIDYVRAVFAVGSDYAFGFNIPKTDKAAASIKAYVWHSFTDTEPLAEAVTWSVK